MTPKQLKEQIGTNITSFRIKEKLTQYEAATMIGISRAHYCNIENGKMLPTLLTVIRICNLFEVHISDIVPTDLTQN